VAVESIHAEAFLDSVLLGDPTLIGATALNGQYIYRNVGRQGGPYPQLVYSYYDGDDINSGNAVRLFTRYVYRVRVVGKVLNGVLQDAQRVRVAANRVDALLSTVRRQSFTVDSVTHFYNVWREDELPPPREEPGQTADVFYRVYGGLYRVEVFD
jgi:hypothetical protein